MSYTTGPALGDYLSLGINTLGALLNGKAKVSAGAWIKPSSWNTDPTDFNANTVFRCNINDTPQAGFSLGFNQSGTPVVKPRLLARSQNGESGQFAEGTTDLQGWAGDGKWHHIGGVANYTTSRIQIYVDGVQEADTAVTFGVTTYTNNVTTAFNDAIGGDGAAGGGAGTTGKTFKGDLAEWAIWGDDIGVAGFAALWARVQPRYVVPAQLLRYWTLRGRYKPSIETDFVAAASLTIVGSAGASASHPDMFVPSGWVE